MRKCTIIAIVVSTIVLAACNRPQPNLEPYVSVHSSTANEYPSDYFISSLVDKFYTFHLDDVGWDAKLVFSLYVDGKLIRETPIPMGNPEEDIEKNDYTVHYASKRTPISNANGEILEYYIGWTCEDGSRVVQSRDVLGQVNTARPASAGYIADDIDVQSGFTRTLYYRVYSNNSGSETTVQKTGDFDEAEARAALLDELGLTQPHQVEILEFQWLADNPVSEASSP